MCILFCVTDLSSFYTHLILISNEREVSAACAFMDELYQKCIDMQEEGKKQQQTPVFFN